MAIAFDVIVSAAGGVRYEWVMKFARRPEAEFAGRRLCADGGRVGSFGGFGGDERIVQGAA